LLLENLADILAHHQFHHDEGSAVVGVVEVVHADRVRMPQFAGDDRFLLKALQEVRVPGDLISNDLDRADFVEGEVTGSVDDTHAANPDAV